MQLRTASKLSVLAIAVVVSWLIFSDQKSDASRIPDAGKAAAKEPQIPRQAPSSEEAGSHDADSALDQASPAKPVASSTMSPPSPSLRTHEVCAQANKLFTDMGAGLLWHFGKLDLPVHPYTLITDSELSDLEALNDALAAFELGKRRSYALLVANKDLKLSRQEYENLRREYSDARALLGKAVHRGYPLALLEMANAYLWEGYILSQRVETAGQPTALDADNLAELADLHGEALDRLLANTELYNGKVRYGEDALRFDAKLTRFVSQLRAEIRDEGYTEPATLPAFASEVNRQICAGGSASR